MTVSERRGTVEDIRSLGVLGRAWTIGILAFSVGRALLAWPTLGQYGVDPWVFLLLDIVTALPYGLGQALTVKILRDRTRPARGAVPWALVVIAAFLAPYVYIFWASGSMPPLAYALVLAWMAVFAVLAVLRIRRQVQAPDRVASAPMPGTPFEAARGTNPAALPDSRRTP